MISVTLFGIGCTAVSDLDLTLRFTITASPDDPSVGDPVRFDFDAAGSSLVGVIVDYGDGAVDSVLTFGATRAQGDVSHSFDLAGHFTGRATAVDAVEGEISDQIVVVVTP